jgi:hypothetical protein
LPLPLMLMMTTRNNSHHGHLFCHRDIACFLAATVAMSSGASSHNLLRSTLRPGGSIQIALVWGGVAVRVTTALSGEASPELVDPCRRTRTEMSTKLWPIMRGCRSQETGAHRNTDTITSSSSAPKYHKIGSETESETKS